ncbi:hypothetical protein [Aquimarina sp. LLG6339-5]|uniref:hypothetical protein n=1 Tax=Aquimarina sp. LLG6339-5 TaxID=3160830 RepID=UPI00386A3867
MKTILLTFFISINVYCQGDKLGYINIERRPLDKVSGSTTLTLAARFADYGEFGGHNEKIIIKRKNKVLEASIIEYSKVCTGCVKQETEKIEKNEIINLTIEKENLIVEYLTKLFRKSLELNVFSNGPDTFQASMSTDYKSVGLDYKDVDFTINYVSDNWNEFKKLKKLLKN